MIFHLMQHLTLFSDSIFKYLILNRLMERIALIILQKITKMVSQMSGIYAYVVSGEDVYVIDTETNTVITTIKPTYEAGIESMAIDPNGKYLYVTWEGMLTVINTADNIVINTGPAVISVSRPSVWDNNTYAYQCPISAFAITPDGKYAYVPGGLFPNNQVIVTEIATGHQSTPIPVGLYPTGIAITPDGRYVYVTNSGSNTISVIDTATNTVSSTIEGISSPTYIVITPGTSSCASGSVCGSSCCTADQTCVGGACCSSESICGSSCCSSSQKCSNGACVTPSSSCGAYTCSVEGSCCGNTSCCLATQTCCGKYCCYPNEACCNPGQTCNIDNICVAE